MLNIPKNQFYIKNLERFYILKNAVALFVYIVALDKNMRS